MNTGKRAGLLAGLAGALLLVAPGSVYAQWNVTGIGVAEYDTEQTLLLLAGVSASPGGRGISPLVGVTGTFLTFEAPGRVNVTTIRPYAGLRSGYDGGSVYGTVGYAFSNRDDAVGVVAADRGSGVTVSGGWDHWGRGDSRLGHQLLGSYNFGSEAYWTRGRVTTRLGDSPAGMRVGGELALLGGEGYSAWQPGAVVEWHNGAGRILGLAAGVKIFDGSNNAFFVRVEGVLPLMRR